MQTLDMIRKHVIPVLRTRRYIHIWDAGCAMGPEPYSLAIILKENMGHMLFRNLTIHATDIDLSNLFADIISKGLYLTSDLQRIPKEYLEKYFSANSDPKYLQISKEIRKSVQYQKHDLLTLKPIRKDFSLIVCKNVLLHFKESERIAVIRMYHDCLSEEGFFVTEQTQKLPSEVAPLFERVVSNAQLFRKKA